MIEPGPRRSLPEPEPGSVANALYVIWGAIGFSILAEFGLLLYLQRTGHVRMADAGGRWPTSTHLALVLALTSAALLLLRTLRSRLRDPGALMRGARAGSSLRPRPRRPSGPPEPASHPAAAFGEGPAVRAVATRFVGFSILQWAAAEALALAGLTVALVLQPAPRAALILYFTLALALWVWYRPDLPALSQALRSAREAG